MSLTNTTESESEDYEFEGQYESDVSLDEEDEELIWRVFFSEWDKQENSEYEDDCENEYESSGEYPGSDESISEDISDISDIDDDELVSKYKELRKLKVDRTMTEEEKKRLLIANFTDDQMERFEAYRRMTVNKPGVKKICNGVLGHSIAHNIAVVIAGISKSFLGEIITKAIEVQDRENKGRLILDIDAKKNQKREITQSLERGQEIEVDDRRLQFDGDRPSPLQPYHVREAWRLYKLENSSAFTNQTRRQGDAEGGLFR
ncbi:Transcription initiation factor TFIID subunit 11 [Spathaspora sp. JA1]|nr:Transcription initiation factor TFIID subunit 11 [Spathaspora sp. JA1]